MKKVQHAIHNAASRYLISPYFKGVESKNIELHYLAAMVEAKQHDIWLDVQRHDKRRKNMSDAVNEVHKHAKRVISNRLKWDARFKGNLNKIRLAQQPNQNKNTNENTNTNS